MNDLHIEGPLKRRRATRNIQTRGCHAGSAAAFVLLLLTVFIYVLT